MRAVRIHLLTYRRPRLLSRALKSLCDQTLDDWVCEVHNDDPDDHLPGELVRQLNDPRITVYTHPSNLGLVKSFNTVFQHRDARYLSILEDDNWWAPDFLFTMVDLLDRRPEVSAGWANMQLWLEQPDGTWVTDGRCIWDVSEHSPVDLLVRPSSRSAFAAAHSQGAMLWRSAEAARAIVPDWVTPSSMEAVRERLMRWPLLFHSRPLGNYAVTIQSVRDADSWKYGRDRSLLLASFCSAIRGHPALRDVLRALRAQVPYSGHGILTAAIAHPEARFLLGYAQWRDWYYLLRSLLRRPRTTLRILRPHCEIDRFAVQLGHKTRELLLATWAAQDATTDKWDFTPVDVPTPASFSP